MRRLTLLILTSLTLLLLPLGLTITPTAQADPAKIQATATVSTGMDSTLLFVQGFGELVSNFDIAAALAKFNAALELDPNRSDVLYWRAQLYYEVGVLDLALADLNTVLASNPDNVDALILRARVYTGPFRVDVPYGYIFLVYHGQIGFGRQHSLAIADLEKALTLDNENPAIWVAYGDVIAAAWYNNNMNLREFTEAEVAAMRDAALERYATALELDPHNVEALYHSGFLTLRPLGVANEYTPAELDFLTTSLSRVTLLVPDTPRAAYAKAMLFWINSETSTAIEELQAAIERYPNYAPLYYWLMLMTDTGYIGQGEEADEMLIINRQSADQAAALAPYSPLYLFNAAYNLYGTPEYIPALAHILEVAPAYPPALARLAYAYVNEGSTESCDAAIVYAGLYLTSNLEVYEFLSFSQEFEFPYNRNCAAATPTPVFIPVTDARYAVGDTLTLPGFGVFSIKESPDSRDSTVFCAAGTEATVLQVIQLESGSVIYVELECDAGVGWIEETLLP